MKKLISTKKADALVRHGAPVKEPEKPASKPASAEEQPQPIQNGPLFSKADIKEIMIEAMKIASRNEKRGTSRLTVNRDGRGFIDTIDITPIDEIAPSAMRH
jgi:hypothetical protein